MSHPRSCEGECGECVHAPAVAVTTLDFMNGAVVGVLLLGVVVSSFDATARGAARNELRNEVAERCLALPAAARLP